MQRQKQGQISDTQAVLTVREVAQKLGLAAATVYRAARRGEIPSIYVGRRILIPAARLERFLCGELP